MINPIKIIKFRKYYFYEAWKIVVSMNNKCLNIGCGVDIRTGWDNCDVVPRNDSVIKFDILNGADLAWLSDAGYDIIECDHVIGYLNYIQVLAFFKSAYGGLNSGGRLILEFPDIIKVSKKLSDVKNLDQIDEYIEMVRAIYAFDPEDAFDPCFAKKTYIFGWSEPIVVRALNEAGFVNIKADSPKTHGGLLWRDSRIEAIR